MIVMTKDKYSALLAVIIREFSSLSPDYVPEYSADFAVDTRTNFLNKLCKEGGTHFPDRWIIDMEKYFHIDSEDLWYAMAQGWDLKKYE